MNIVVGDGTAMGVGDWSDILENCVPNQKDGVTHRYVAEKIENGNRRIRTFINREQIAKHDFTLLSLESICRLSDDILNNDQREDIYECNRDALLIRGNIQRIIDAKQQKVNTTANKVLKVVINLLKFILVGFLFLGVERKLNAAKADVEVANQRNQIQNWHHDFDPAPETMASVIRRGGVIIRPFWWNSNMHTKILYAQGAPVPQDREKLLDPNYYKPQI